MSRLTLAEKAIQDALQYENALLKFITPNNVGLTGSHECGYYLPKKAWKLFSDHPPKKGLNTDKLVKINWQDGEQVTDSVVKWYGAKTRSEYRLTRFGRGFPYLTPDNVGDMLVLVRTGKETFNAYVFNSSEDIENIQAGLGIEIIDNVWGVYSSKIAVKTKIADDCIEKCFHSFISKIKVFPPTIEFSGTTIKTVLNCILDFKRKSCDKQLLLLLDREYNLFKMAESFLHRDDVSRHYKTIDEFLTVANSILNRRKSRAGKSLGACPA